jgi:5-methylcytosine-specific restriction endonuclease McrA
VTLSRLIAWCSPPSCYADLTQPHERRGGPRNPQAERALSGTTASKAAAAALEALSREDSAESAWAGLSRYRALVLDSSYRPIDVVNWQRAILMDLMEKADVLEYFDAVVHSVSMSFYLPAVVRARRGRAGAYQARVALNRRNVLARDKLACQYCGRTDTRTLTLDHVVPRSKGGQHTWENLVTACAPCNSKKGDKTLRELRWKLRTPPKEPSAYQLDHVLSAVIGADKKVPHEWESYLFNDA